MNKASTRGTRATAKQTSKTSKKFPLKTIKRTKISIGKQQRVSRAQSMAENKSIRGTIASEQSQGTVVEPQQATLPPVLLEQKKQQLIALLDIPRAQTKKIDLVLSELAEMEMSWTPAEIGQILSLAARGNSSNFKAGAKIFQAGVAQDHLPYKSAIRGMARLFEHGHHFSAATATVNIFQNLYPTTQYDDYGMPKEKVVLTESLPDFVSLSTSNFEPSSVDSIESYQKAIVGAKQGIHIRFDTQHHYIRQLLRKKDIKSAIKQLFVLFERIGVHANDTVPGKFDPIPFQTIFHKGPVAVNFKPDFPLYYAVIDAAIGAKEWSTAMTSLVYVRTFNKPLDVTPVREMTQNKQWRDFLDLHTHDPQTARLVVNHFKRELLVRRGYRAEVEVNAAGVADAKTYSANTRENAMSYSPLIATEPEDLVILTDRSYNVVNVVQEKGGIQFTTAFAVAQQFNTLGIDAKISHGGVLSSSQAFFEHFTQNPDSLTGPLANGKKTPVAYDLTVVVPKAELINFATRTFETLPQQVADQLDTMPVVAAYPKGFHARQWRKFTTDQQAAKEELAQQKKAQ